MPLVEPKPASFEQAVRAGLPANQGVIIRLAKYAQNGDNCRNDNQPVN